MLKTNSYDTLKNNCEICQSPRIEKLFQDYRDNAIWHCPDCSVQFMNPQYSDQYLNEFYSGYTDDNEDEIWREPCHYGFGVYLSLTEKAMQREAGPIASKTLFDFGCGCGLFLELAQSKGWQVEGYDVDPVTTQSVAERLSCSVHSGDFFSLKIDKKFSLVIMHQVLEHLKNPVTYFKKIKDILEPRGFVFVAVPNISSASNRMKYFLEKIKVRKKRVGAYYDTSHHLFYYNRDSLTRLLDQMGFDVVYHRNCHKTYPGQSSWKRFIAHTITDHLFSNSAFFVVARKRD